MVKKKMLANEEVQETLVQSLSRENSEEGNIPTHSSILVWRIP